MSILVYLVLVLALAYGAYYLYNGGYWDKGSIKDFVTFKDRHFVISDKKPRSQDELKAALIEHVSSLKEKPLEDRDGKPSGTD